MLRTSDEGRSSEAERSTARCLKTVDTAVALGQGRAWPVRVAGGGYGMNHWYAVGELTRQHHADLDGEATRDGLARSVRTGGGHRSWLARFAGTIRGLGRRDPSLTDLPCRLPDGRIGRIRVVEQQGDRVLVCRVA